MPEKENTIKDLREAFGCEGRPVSVTEYKEFWASLSDEEKAYYKTAPLS